MDRATHELLFGAQTVPASLGIHDDMGKWLLFLAVAGGWIAVQYLFLVWVRWVSESRQ